MQVVTRKSEIKELINICTKEYESKGLNACLLEMENYILTKKIKFPLLEFCGDELYQKVKQEEHIDLCNKIEELKTEGGNVILGIILQNRLNTCFEQSIKKATEYISRADVWYVCDIIGERVYGYALLNNPEKTIPQIKKLSRHSANWVVRALGAGIHYSIKKGLDKENVALVFPILLSMANTRDKEIRQGVGWAAKTTAKFHPEIIDQFDKEVQNKEMVANWFRTKISIGLNRNEYAKRN
ncbi:DNA alkylation repair protein [Hanstruepera marina]|uniref:DNA alkylation repair protein n=1 Tax=Hanstruepera marina TaxID=2873265 RepID=UPI001CA6C80B|nr:DNA alkylation repair protein [Hanstruepera marina]